MKRIITSIFCILASLVAVNGAAAQQRVVRVVIPFDFIASGHPMPAGAYTIATENGLTSLTMKDTRKRAFVTAIPVIDNLPGDSKVTFAIYGGQHFLRKVLCTDINMSLELLPSKAEKRARVQSANTRVQSVNTSGD